VIRSLAIAALLVAIPVSAEWDDWDLYASGAEFQGMGYLERQRARNEYYDKEIESQLQRHERYDAWLSFMTHTRPMVESANDFAEVSEQKRLEATRRAEAERQRELSYAECILENMKGTQGDITARAIVMACRSVSGLD
jgi:hypothetical protein